MPDFEMEIELEDEELTVFFNAWREERATFDCPGAPAGWEIESMEDEHGEEIPWERCKDLMRKHSGELSDAIRDFLRRET